MGIHARRDRRYNFQISVSILSRSGEMQLVTEDVSYRGVFLRTATPPPKMQLVRLRLTLPTQEKKVLTNAMVAHVPLPDARVQGAGVSFFGLDGEPRRQWEHFIQFVRDHHPDAAERQAAADHAAEQDRLRAREQIIIAVGGMPAFERLVARDVAQGNLSVYSDAPLAVDAPVSVRLVHPLTQNDFLLEGVVRRHIRGGGISVGLAPLDQKRQDALREFVRGDDCDAIEIIDFESVRPPRQSAQPRPIA
jgi:hypothetical protein